MAWVRLTNSTTADADEVHGNLALIGSGDRLPMKLSDTASYTASAYDLGSSTYPWKDIYADRLISKTQYVLLTTVSIAATSTQQLISGLTIDNFESFIFKAKIQLYRLTGSTMIFGLTLNSTTSNYSTRLVANAGAWTAINGIGMMPFIYGSAASFNFLTQTLYFKSEAIFNAEVGFKNLNTNGINRTLNGIPWVFNSGSGFYPTTTGNVTITTMDLFMTTNTTIDSGYIQIFGLPKTSTALA